MNSELVRFEIVVKDVNEFPPVLLPTMTSATILEPSAEDQPAHILVNEFRLDCSDRDINSTLNITLDSVQYVSKYDLNRVLESDNSYDLEPLFGLVHSNQSSADYQSAYVTYSNTLNYDKLMRPTEILILLKVTCSDGEFQAKSRVYIQVEDRNDNRPIFSTNRISIKRPESNTLQTLVKVVASDADLSPEYGNYSLEYSIVECVPNLYDMYIDPRTGQMSSRLIIDIDTPEIIKQRKSMNSLLNSNGINETQLKEQIDFLVNFNKIQCEIMVKDNQLYKPSNSSVTWYDIMEVEIEIESVNDNPPEIQLDPKSSLVEVEN